MKRTAILIAIILLVALTSCDTGGDTGGDTPADTGPLVIARVELDYFGSAIEAEVYIRENGTYEEYSTNYFIDGDSVDSATVSINGITADYDSFSRSYTIDNLNVSPGDDVSLVIEHADFSVDTTSTLPAPVTLTSPVSLSDFSTGDAIPLSWTAFSSTPDELEIRIAWTDTIDEEARWYQLSPTDTSYTIPAGVMEISFMSDFRINSINRRTISASGVSSRSQFIVSNSLDIEY